MALKKELKSLGVPAVTISIGDNTPPVVAAVAVYPLCLAVAVPNNRVPAVNKVVAVFAVRPF